MVGWQARAYDAVPTRKDKIVRRILSRVKPGGIILLHDGCDGKTNPDRAATVEALKEIIPALKERGYEFKKVSELIKINNESPHPVSLSREERESYKSPSPFGRGGRG